MPSNLSCPPLLHSIFPVRITEHVALGGQRPSPGLILHATTSSYWANQARVIPLVVCSRTALQAHARRGAPQLASNLDSFEARSLQEFRCPSMFLSWRAPGSRRRTPSFNSSGEPSRLGSALPPLLVPATLRRDLGMAREWQAPSSRYVNTMPQAADSCNA
jgi:hypothetical protein